VALVLALASVSSAAQTAPSLPAQPSLVQRVLSTYSVRGIIGMQRHFATVINGGPVHHTEQSESGLLTDDGAYVKIKYYRIVRDGRAFSAGDLAKRESQTNSDWAAGKVFFKEPYDRRYSGDYSFTLPGSSAACAAGTIAVSFKSPVQDIQHGSGTMCVRSADAHVIKLTYVPNAYPPHASSGSVTETSSEVLPGLWYVTRIDETYSGHAFILSGTASFTGIVDHFKHFATLGEGEAALANGSL